MTLNENNKYNEIINLPHHVSKKHPRMSVSMRSAQFAPFAALTGYSDEITEAARITSKEITISDDIKNIIDIKIRIIYEHIKEVPKINIIFFKKDKIKDGGKYIEYTGNLKKIDMLKQTMIFNDGLNVNINNIFDIKQI